MWFVVDWTKFHYRNFAGGGKAVRRDQRQIQEKSWV